MSDVIEQEAEILDVDLAPMSGADKWLAGVSERVLKTSQEYSPYKIENGDQYRQAKRERSAVRRDITEIENERKSITRRIDDAVKSFRDGAKDVLRPLTDLDEGYKAEIDAYEESVLSRRRAELKETYEEMAPLMAIPPEDRALVLFDRIVEKYGMGRQGKKKWFNYSTSIEDARNQLIDALRDIQDGEATVSKAVTSEMVDEARAIYFDTLDIGATLTEIRRREDQMARLAALDNERRAIEEPEPEPEPEPQPQPEPEATSVWVFAGYGTKAQADAFRAFCVENGIERHIERDTLGRSYKLTVRG